MVSDPKLYNPHIVKVGADYFLSQVLSNLDVYVRPYILLSKKIFNFIFPLTDLKINKWLKNKRAFKKE